MAARPTGIIRACWLSALLAAAPLFAQAPPLHPVPAPAAFDPSDVYFQAWLQVKDAEKLEQQGDFAAALEKLERARQLFDAVARQHPQWKTAMVAGRLAATDETITRVRPQADAQRKPAEEALAELEGPLKRRADDQPPAPPAGRQPAASPPPWTTPAAPAPSPVESQLGRLTSRIADLERERDATGQALAQSRADHQAAADRIAAVEAELARARQQAADLDRNIKTERRVANEVIRGQQEQLRQLRETIEAKDRELATARGRIGELERTLAETHDAFTELRAERDALLRERDHMAALLKLNEAGRIQELIEQNVALNEQLRQANDRVEVLKADANTTKDELTEALRDLAIAKVRIINLQKEGASQRERLAALEDRLRRADQELTASHANPEEANMLRDIIRRQLRIQERRRQTRDLLLQQVKRMGLDHAALGQALALIEGEQLRLSPDESRLVATRQVDDEFVAPFPASPGQREQALSRVEQERHGLDHAGARAFTNNRLAAAEELFSLVLDAHPGHVPTLLKLGVVRLKRDDPATAADAFRDAVAMDAENAYGHRMLGVALYKLGNHDEAEAELRHAIAIDPADAKAHVFLGNTTFHLGRKSEAETHFKAAIQADPTLNEPYFNLATLYAGTGRTNEGRDYYQQALDCGALPDPALERRLGL